MFHYERIRLFCVYLYAFVCAIYHPVLCFDLFWIYINFLAKLADKWSIIANLLWFEKEGVTRAIWCIRLWMDSRKRLNMYCFRVFLYFCHTGRRFSFDSVGFEFSFQWKNISLYFFKDNFIQIMQQTLFAKHSK